MPCQLFWVTQASYPLHEMTVLHIETDDNVTQEERVTGMRGCTITRRVEPGQLPTVEHFSRSITKRTRAKRRRTGGSDLLCVAKGGPSLKHGLAVWAPNTRENQLTRHS